MLVLVNLLGVVLLLVGLVILFNFGVETKRDYFSDEITKRTTSRIIGIVIGVIITAYSGFVLGFNIIQGGKIDTITENPIENIQLLEEIHSISVGTEINGTRFSLSNTTNGDVFRYRVVIDGAYVYKTMDIRTPVFESDDVKPGIYNRALYGNRKVFAFFKITYKEDKATDKIIIVPVGSVVAEY